MKKFLLTAFASAAFVFIALLIGEGQTVNTFPALQHFPGAPTNPCQATFLAQNDSNDFFYTCDVNTLNWVQIGSTAPGGGGATPGLTFPVRFDYLMARSDSVSGVPNGTFQTFGSLGGVIGTGTEVEGQSYGAGAVGSANSVGQVCYLYGANPNQGFIQLGTVNRWSMRLRTTVASPARYWAGILDTFSGACNGGNASYATDTPNLPYCGFRFSSGTDTTWKAVCGTDNTHQTVVDTGVALATATSTLLEMSPTAGAASVRFFINGNLVATVTTNVPTSSYRFGEAFFVDNKNTATAEAVTFYWEQILYTK